MFIIERRTVGVLAALAIPAVVAILSNVWDRADGIADSPSAMSTAAFVTSVGPSVPPIALDPADPQARGAQRNPVTRNVEVPQSIDALTASN